MNATCNFCTQPAIYDGKTIMGPWAYMCEFHFGECGLSNKLVSVLAEIDN